MTVKMRITNNFLTGLEPHSTEGTLQHKFILLKKKNKTIIQSLPSGQLLLHQIRYNITLEALLQLFYLELFPQVSASHSKFLL